MIIKKIHIITKIAIVWQIIFILNHSLYFLLREIIFNYNVSVFCIYVAHFLEQFQGIFFLINPTIGLVLSIFSLFLEKHIKLIPILLLIINISILLLLILLLSLEL